MQEWDGMCVPLAFVIGGGLKPNYPSMSPLPLMDHFLVEIKWPIMERIAVGLKGLFCNLKECTSSGNIITQRLFPSFNVISCSLKVKHC